MSRERTDCPEPLLSEDLVTILKKRKLKNIFRKSKLKNFWPRKSEIA